MKKNIIIAVCLLFSICVKSQINADVTITAVSPTLVCPGDSLSISITFTPPPVNNTYLTRWFDLNPKHTYDYTRIYEVNYHAFYLLPKQVVNGDTVYTFKIKLPSVFHGDSVKVMTGQSFQYITFCDNTTGIESYSLNTHLNPVYYDLQGNRIPKRANELIIEQIGFTRRKIIISE